MHDEVHDGVRLMSAIGVCAIDETPAPHYCFHRYTALPEAGGGAVGTDGGSRHGHFHKKSLSFSALGESVTACQWMVTTVMCLYKCVQQFCSSEDMRWKGAVSKPLHEVLCCRGTL